MYIQAYIQRDATDKKTIPCRFAGGKKCTKLISAHCVSTDLGISATFYSSTLHYSRNLSALSYIYFAKFK